MRRAFLDVRDGFGFAGDGVTDDSAAIQKAVDAANGLGLPVFLPYRPGNPSTNVRGFILCNSSILLHSGTTIFGAGRKNTEIRFNNDTDGFYSDPAVFTVDVSIKDLYVRGNANTSSSATASTAGIRANQSTRWNVERVAIDRFLDGLVLDARSGGVAIHRYTGMQIGASDYPNPTNRYQRYLVRFLAGTNKPQLVWFEGQLYATGTGNTATFNGDGATTDFSFTATLPVWQETGVKVYVQDANLVWSRKVAGVDYDLKHSGSTIAPGAQNVNQTTFTIHFYAAPAAATGNVKVGFNDPTCKKCLYVDGGTGNYFNIGVSGGETGIQFSDSGVYTSVYASVNQNLRFATNRKDVTVRVKYVCGGAATATTIAAASGGDVTVTLSSVDGTNPTATANDVRAAIFADPTCRLLIPDIDRVYTGTGAGVIPASLGALASFTTLAAANAGDAGQNVVQLNYAQLCNTGVKLGANAPRTSTNITEFPVENIDTIIDIDPAGSGLYLSTVGPGAGWEWSTLNKTADQTVTSSSYVVVTFDGPVNVMTFTDYVFGHREVQLEAEIELNNAGGTTIDASVELAASYDGGATYTVLRTANPTANVGGASSVSERRTLIVNAVDSQLLPAVIAQKRALYRVRAKVTTGTNIKFLGTVFAQLRARSVNPA